MSRTMTMKLAGVCALAMSVASGALAHGGGMGGTSNAGHAAIPSPNASRPVMESHSPVLSGKTVITGSRQPVIGTRIPALGTKQPTVTMPRPSTGSDGAQLDPLSGNE